MLSIRLLAIKIKARVEVLRLKNLYHLKMCIIGHKSLVLILAVLTNLIVLTITMYLSLASINTRAWSQTILIQVYINSLNNSWLEDLKVIIAILIKPLDIMESFEGFR